MAIQNIYFHRVLKAISSKQILFSYIGILKYV